MAHAAVVSPGTAVARRSGPFRGLPVTPGMRAVSAWFATSATVIVVVSASTLIWTTTRLRDGTENVASESDDAALVGSIDRELLRYRRVVDLEAATGSVDPTGERLEAQQKISDLLAEASRRASNQHERSLVASARSHIEAYFHARDEARRGVRPLDELIARTDPALENAFADLDALDAIADASVARARAEAEELATAADVAVAADAVALVLLAITLGWAAKRFVAVPVLALSAAMTRFRGGATEVRAPRAGAREIVDAADQFNAMADALSRQRDGQLTFLASVIHDFRSPLGALKLGIASLRRARTGANTTRTFDLVDRQVDRLARLVDDLLDAARIESGRLELRPERDDVRTSLQEIVDFFAPTSPAHEIRLDLPDEPLLVDADPARIEQTLANLVSNAIKYSPAGGLIEVRAAREGEGPAQKAAISVRDHGIGIASEDLPDIFAPFRRRAPSIATGTGLGLSVARRIVEAHGGTIEAASRVGEGTELRIRLPLSRLQTEG